MTFDELAHSIFSHVKGSAFRNTGNFFLWSPESGKNLLVGSGILLTIWIQNPSSINQKWNPESTIWSPVYLAILHFPHLLLFSLLDLWPHLLSRISHSLKLHSPCLFCLVPENIKTNKETRNKNKNTGDRSLERAPHYEKPRTVKGSRWGLGKGLQTPRTSHVLPCHVTKEKKNKLKFFLPTKMHFWTLWRVFFGLSVTRKLYPKSADQTLRQFESGNKA